MPEISETKPKFRMTLGSPLTFWARYIAHQVAAKKPSIIIRP